MKTRYTGLIALILFFTIGFSRWTIHDQRGRIPTLESSIDGCKAYTALITSPSTEKNKYYMYDVISSTLLIDSTEIQADFFIKLYIKKDSSRTQIPQYGDVLVIKGKPFRIPGPKNPHEFDYSAYMKGQNVFFQQFINHSQYLVIRNQAGSKIMKTVWSIREKFETIIKYYIQGIDNQAIALALLIGQKDDLSQDIKKSYAAAGAMHVLAVSGLHVGIIYMLIMALFRPFKSNIIVKTSAAYLCIICLWLYALITGFSPSILRAVTMFSVIIFGQCLARKSNIYNSITFSAFILLMYNPNFLFSVGFQLSYLAVLGIVLLYQPLYNLLHFRYWLMDKIWSILSVSIAAQVATAPISIYYFHQFPTYFLFTNLIVIPAAFCIMMLGIMLLLSSAYPIGGLFGMSLEFCIIWLNKFVSWIHQLPHSKADWLYLTSLQTSLIYLSMIWLAFFFITKQFKHFILSSMMISLLIIVGVWNVLVHHHQRKLIIYHARGYHLADHVDGLHTRLITLNKLDELDMIKHQVDPNRLNSYLPQLDYYENLDTAQYSIGNFVVMRLINGKKICHLYDAIAPNYIFIRIKTDVLIVSNDASTSIAELMDYFDFEHLIVDSSNDYQTGRKLKKGALNEEIEFSLISDKAIDILSGE